MKNKGFTLIELLAVIVILAIIALIAVPIILNIIGDTKKSADQRSAELYLDAVEKAVAAYNLTGEFPDAVCTIQAGGNLSCTDSSTHEIFPVEVTVNNSNQIKAGGTITFTNSKITAVEDLVVNDNAYRLANNELVLVEPAAPVPATDASCFVYQTVDVTWVTGVTEVSNMAKCKTITLDYAISMGFGASDFTDSVLESICDGTNEDMSAEKIASYNPDYAALLYEAGALTGASVQQLDGAHITGYDASCGTDVIIPSTLGGKNVTVIENRAFKEKNLTSVTIPNTVTTIGEKAFQNNALASVTLGNSVTTIGDSAFNVNQLTSVTIPDSVTTIGKYAFKANKLTSVTISNSITTIEEQTFYGNDLTSVTIPNSVTTIGARAFNFNDLTSVTLGNSVTTIGHNAFSYNQLTSVTIPSSVTTIDINAFSYNQLTSVTLGNNVTTIGNNAFSYNKLTSITIPSSVTTIDYNAFGCGYGEGEDQITRGPNAIESVTLEGKNSTSDFESYGNNVFCWITGKSDANINE